MVVGRSWRGRPRRGRRDGSKRERVRAGRVGTGAGQGGAGQGGTGQGGTGQGGAGLSGHGADYGYVLAGRQRGVRRIDPPLVRIGHPIEIVVGAAIRDTVAFVDAFRNNNSIHVTPQ
jgi:hypothetical protein